MLRCPMTQRPLTVADASLVERLNRRIAAGRLANRAGDAIDEPLDGGLVEATDGWLYPIWDAIPALVPDEAISIDENEKTP